jgi:hypothetical protein
VVRGFGGGELKATRSWSPEDGENGGVHFSKGYRGL